MPQQEKDPYSNHRNHEGNLVGTTPGAENYSNHVNYGYYEGNWVDGSSAVALETPGNAPSNGNYVNYGSYDGNLADGSSAVALETSANVPVNENYGSYVDYGGYESNWGDVSTATKAPEKSGGIDWAGGILGKRGRNEIPADIIEVKQDELMSNRPREDQAKLTGIAFGPAYQVLILLLSSAFSFLSCFVIKILIPLFYMLLFRLLGYRVDGGISCRQCGYFHYLRIKNIVWKSSDDRLCRIKLAICLQPTEILLN